jgi:hypothetical protein
MLSMGLIRKKFILPHTMNKLSWGTSIKIFDPDHHDLGKEYFKALVRL